MTATIPNRRRTRRGCSTKTILFKATLYGCALMSLVAHGEPQALIRSPWNVEPWNLLPFAFHTTAQNQRESVVSFHNDWKHHQQQQQYDPSHDAFRDSVSSLFGPFPEGAPSFGFPDAIFHALSDDGLLSLELSVLSDLNDYGGSSEAWTFVNCELEWGDEQTIWTDESTGHVLPDPTDVPIVETSHLEQLVHGMEPIKLFHFDLPSDELPPSHAEEPPSFLPLWFEDYWQYDSHSCDSSLPEFLPFTPFPTMFPYFESCGGSVYYGGHNSTTTARSSSSTIASEEELDDDSLSVDTDGNEG
ncbi:expressed unknown protein [Seminavis robusta]|uniref:Uncharacterized protein n=1 Tax=Seminavis robusta TaxID=568900 RepID=A0A9N8E8B3_9STRA|nr:expressed unknown protein [Seminavis robusta]|eukprot:Sro605_g174270.1 n/a (302) ;mRNA; r:18510-19415